jgi:hypothetical protein
MEQSSGLPTFAVAEETPQFQILIFIFQEQRNPVDILWKAIKEHQLQR